LCYRARIGALRGSRTLLCTAWKAGDTTHVL